MLVKHVLTTKCHYTIGISTFAAITLIAFRIGYQFYTGDKIYILRQYMLCNTEIFGHHLTTLHESKNN